MFAKSAIAVAAVAGLVSAAPAAVTSAIAPKETTPAGCSPNYDGTFEIQVLNVTQAKSKRDESKPLISTLVNGVLTDSSGRTGYIASNQQFQYDGPPQAGAIYTAGFSVCANGSLALGNSAIFYQCLSGTFYNLYDENVAAQCSPVYIEVLRQSATSGSATVANAMKDGQVTALPVSNVACQIGDGQLQQNTCTGQIVTQIADGQIQAATGVVTQIGDGQIQAPTAVANPVTQIGDGQIQAPANTGRPVTQIGDGQIQAANGTVSSQPSVVAFTGSASTLDSSVFGLVACFAAVLAL